ncbi:LysR family transcriptional regulator [Caballeronia sp. dw_19]|jgi:DNA-binding transcriptional LysR family regulator|uniref:LysR family transcriptional regulator n=1 Tax=Caballeronia sp. dw_19 TaxID=2719791 RepID=UPI0032119E0F
MKEGAQRLLRVRAPAPFPMTLLKKPMPGVLSCRSVNDLQHIRAFVAVAREGSLTRAAQLLHLTQPAVSLQLKSFQDQLNLRLLARSPRGLTLTTDGLKLLPYAENILHAIGDFEAAAGNMLTVLSGTVSIGTILNPQTIRLGAILQHMASHYPEVRTRLRHAMTGQVLDQIRSGTLDAGFYLGMPGDIDGIEFHAIALMPITYYVIAPKGWQDRINGRGWTELAALPWIWTPPTSTHHRMLSHAFDAAGVRPQVAAEVDLEASMVELVRAGVGLSLARESVAIDEAQKYGVAISRELPIEIPLSFITQARRREEPLIEAIFLAAQMAFA